MIALSIAFTGFISSSVRFSISCGGLRVALCGAFYTFLMPRRQQIAWTQRKHKHLH